jgi:DNA-damage-inducible protein J
MLSQISKKYHLKCNDKYVTIVIWEVIYMEKSTTLNLRVNPTVKQRAEDILSQLGIPMSTAIDMYLKQISMVGGIPFSVTLPKAPESINADTMDAAEIREKLEKGYADFEAGRVQNAAEAFAKFRKNI